MGVDLQRNHAPAGALTSKLFIPVLLLSLLSFGFSFDWNMVTKSIGVNTYLVIIIGLMITIISLFAVKSLAERYPEQSIIRLGNKLLGPLGRVGAPVWLIVIFILTALLIRRVTDGVAAIILFRTPEFVSVLAFLLIVTYLALLGEQALGRLAAILTFSLPLLMIMLILGFRQVNFLNIHPVSIYRDLDYLGKWDLWLPVFIPVWILCPFYGNESLRNNFKGIILAITGGTLLLAAVFLATAGAFGPAGINRYQWPVMSLMNITEMASSYFFQNFITTFYFLIFLPFSLVTVAGFLIVLVKGLTEYLNLKNPDSKLIPIAIGGALFILAQITPRINYKEIVDLALKAGGLYTFGYILLIWFSFRFRGREQK